MFCHAEEGDVRAGGLKVRSIVVAPERVLIPAACTALLELEQMVLALRTAGPEDEAFLYQVYAATRADEMAIVPWTAEQKEAFLRMQFNAQTESYKLQFPKAETQIILNDEVPAGRFIVDRSDSTLLMIDIALLPEHRNRGTGATLLRGLQAEGAEVGKPVRLHVESFNPAQRLYERLGFQKVSEDGLYWCMEWRPGAAGGQLEAAAAEAVSNG
jgi:ribosomal protein S18 acetylase RimI-like enzyme